MAALLLSANPSLTNTQVYAAMESTAIDLGTPGFDNVTGYGLVNAPAAFNAVFSATPGRPALLPSSDTGFRNNDGLTNLNNSAAAEELQFQVSGTVVGATVTLYNGGATAIGSAVASGSTTMVTTDGTTTLSDGIHSITARQTELNKATSFTSSAFSIRIDTVAPSAPNVPILEAASDAGVSNSDGITAETQPTLNLSGYEACYRLFRNGVQIGGDYGTAAAYTETSACPMGSTTTSSSRWTWPGT